MKAQIQIHFPIPGEWNQFLLTALWQDAEGYECRRSYTPADIPTSHQPALQAVVDTLVALDAPWQVNHVIAEYGDKEDRLELTAHVQRLADGAERYLTSAEIPQLRLSDPAAIALFHHLTSEHHHA